MTTWTQLTIHDKPCIAVNVAGYFDPLIAQFDRAVDEGFVRAEQRGMIVAVATPADAIAMLRA